MPDAELGLLERGDPQLPAILFLHAAATTRHFFARQLDALSGEFHCLSLDQEGHGDLAPDGRDGTWSMTPSVRCAARVIRERTMKREALVVGVSLGGYTAMELVRQHGKLVT